MILKFVKASAFAALPLLGLSACSTMSGGPERLEVGNSDCVTGAVSQSIRNVRIADQCTTVDWLSGNSNALKLQRNNVITTRMYLADLKYNDWKRDFFNENRNFNFLSALASIGLSGAGSVITAGDTARTLAAIDTALKGGKQGFDKEIMLDQTLEILKTQMAANRAKIKELILKRLSTNYEEWPIGLAMADLEAYEDAGTLSEALTAIAENSAADKAASEAGAQQAIKTSAYDASAAGVALQNYFDVDSAKHALREAQFLKALAAASANDIKREDIALFVFGDDLRKKDVLVQLIALEKDDAEALKVLAPGLAK